MKDFSTFEIPVDKFARVNESQFIDSLTINKPGLAVLQFANHEVGTQQPINPIYKKYYVYPIKNMPIYLIDKYSMMSAVRYAITLSSEKREQLGKNAFKSYLEDTKFFIEKIQELCQ